MLCLTCHLVSYVSAYGVNGNATGIGAYTLQGSYNSQKYNGNVGI